ncbi:hypothetical protein KQJ25_41155, partial [Escherichia sp. S69_ASV_4]|nr:hypothetical protein [Escherichia sp. S69_ASV_4]
SDMCIRDRYVIAEELGISRAQFDQFLRMMQGGAQFGGGYQQQTGGGNWQQAQRGPTLEDACNVPVSYTHL